jgi:hypothetical protein
MNDIHETRSLAVGQTDSGRVARDGCCERVIILEILHHPDWGNYLLYRPVTEVERYYIPPPYCMSESYFLSLYPLLEESPCNPSHTENSSCTTSSHRPLPWYTALRERCSRVISFFRPPW